MAKGSVQLCWGSTSPGDGQRPPLGGPFLTMCVQQGLATWEGAALVMGLCVPLPACRARPLWLERLVHSVVGPCDMPVAWVKVVAPCLPWEAQSP